MDGRITDRAPGATALLIVDMLNAFDFDGAQPLRDAATEASHAVAALRDAADAAGVPVIYVNDNGDRWHSDPTRLIDHVVAHGGEARDIAERLRPRSSDFFVIKPQFSGFYATNLPVLLPRLGVNRLILTGVAADICVLFTAADAHMRDYALWVPGDAVASLDPQRTRWALDIMAQSMAADTRTTGEQPFADWLAAG